MAVKGWGIDGFRKMTGLKILFQKSDFSEDKVFWIPAFAGMTVTERAFARGCRVGWWG